MSLFTLHKLLITTAIVFLAGFGLRGLVMAMRGHASWATALLSVAAAAASVGLVGYLRWLIRTKSALAPRPPPRRRPLRDDAPRA
jgi:hypothetical protein